MEAVVEGSNMRKDYAADLQAAEAEAQLPDEMRDELSDEDLLGASTLAKMKGEEKAEAEKAAEEVEAEETEEAEAEETEAKEAVEDVTAEQDEKEDSEKA